jgi:MFS family permease
VSGVIRRSFGTKWPLVLGAAAISTGLALVAMWRREPWEVVLALSLLGFGLPLVTGGSAHVLLETVERTQTGVALGMNNVSRQLGGLVGGQLCAAVLSSQSILSSNAPTPSRFVIAFALCAAAGAVGIATAALVTPRTPERRTDSAVADAAARFL